MRRIEGDTTDSSGSGSHLTLIGACLALIMLGVIVVPWPTPTPEVLVKTFVPDLITIDPRGFLQRAGRVHVAERELALSTVPNSQPTVHLLTTEVPFTAVFSVTVLKRDSSNVFPFQVKVWNPKAEVAVEAWYAPDGAIMAGIRTNGQWQQTRRLGTYELSALKTWRIVRSYRRVLFEVSGQGEPAAFDVDWERFPVLFEQDIVSLTIYASATMGGSSTAVVRNPIISVPSQERYGTTVQSPWFRPTVVLAALFGFFWLIAVRARTRWGRLKVPPKDLAIMLLLTGASLVIGWWLSKTPGHPYDERTVVTWSGIARMYGPAAITPYSLIATEGGAHGGQPYAAMPFSYPPLLAYLFWFVGKAVQAERVEAMFKMVAVVSVAAGGGLLFVLLRHLRVAPALAALATGAYVLNPAVLFDSAVWGQTEAFVGFLLLLGAAGVILGSAPLLWSGALLAALTKQTGILFGLIIVALGIARLGPRQMIRGSPVAVVIAFLVLAPGFFAGIHPSAVYRPAIATIHAFGALSNPDSVISQSALTLWSTVSSLEGARGWERFAFPDFVATRLGLPYSILSRLAFGLFALILVFLVYRARPISPCATLVVIAVYMVGAVFLLTRVSPRYFYFGLMFTAAALPWIPRRLVGPVLIALTGTMLVSMWGLFVFTSIWYPGLLPMFQPERSWLNAVAASALGSDIGITLGGLLNMGVLLALLFALTQCSRDSGSLN